MPEYAWRNINVHFERLGSGKPVVMVHAMSVSGAYWRRVVDALQGSYDLLLPDLPFHGRTGALSDPAQHRHDDNAELLCELVKALFQGPVHVVGHSYGGASAVAFILKYPTLVDRVVLIEPSLPMILLEAGEAELLAEFLEMGDRFDRSIEAGDPQDAWRAYVDAQSGIGTWQAMADEKKQRILATTDQAYAVGKAIKGNSLKLSDLHRLRCTTMMVVGDQTPARHRRTAEVIRDHIPGCSMTVIPGASHMSPGSHPTDIAAIIDRHFS
jgi:pimeloyl-ACP methyl ester carboxylesterase